jgi:malonyl-CoA O-methyltransferase
MLSNSAESVRPGAEIKRLEAIFDRRAAGFGEVDFLPREIAQRMRERLDYIKLQPARVLDAGCGPGADLAPLRERYPGAAVIGLDLSHRMAQIARGDVAPSGWRRMVPAALRAAVGAPGQAGGVLQGDYAQLPFGAASFDLLWSNLALQWHATPDRIFPEWQRVLKVGGLLMFSTLGPDTLRELRVAGKPDATLSFVDMHDFGDMLVASGFETPVMDAEILTVTYRSAQALLRDVRRWGGEARDGLGPRGLGGRAALAQLTEALEAQRRDDGTLALTFEVIYGHAWKAQAKMTQLGYGVIRPDEIGRGAGWRVDADAPRPKGED